jgi:hypothetical protein
MICIDQFLQNLRGTNRGVEASEFCPTPWPEVDCANASRRAKQQQITRHDVGTVSILVGAAQGI